MSDSDYINPFDEVFDEKDVVNRDKPFEDFGTSEQSKKDAPIDPRLMADIISDGENFSVREIPSDDDDEVFGLIKKEEIDSGKFLVEEVEDFQGKETDDADESEIDDLSISHIGDELQEPEESEIAHSNDSKEITPKTQEESSEVAKRPEEEIEEYLRANFKDFISLPKISGSLVKSYENNLLSRTEVSNTGKTVEISDSAASTTDPSHKTSVIINRDNGGEIESIEVVCKCGERTLITFDYGSSKDYDNELTEVVDSPIEKIPFEDLQQESENIMILDPDLILPKHKNDEIDDSSDEQFDGDEEDDDYDYYDDEDGDEEDDDYDYYDDEDGDEEDGDDYYDDED